MKWEGRVRERRDSDRDVAKEITIVLERGVKRGEKVESERVIERNKRDIVLNRREERRER